MNPLHDLLQDKFTDLPDITFPAISTVTAEPQIEPTTKNASTTEKIKDSNIPIDSIRKKLYDLQTQLNEIIRTVDALSSASQTQTTQSSEVYLPPQELSQGMIIEGVFTGNKMMGSDGKEYEISPNYASKSKLVEGDFLKLTITPHGKFFFKQIGPVTRTTVVGEAWYDTDLRQWFVIHNQNRYKLLLACATFYKLVPGQMVTILIPEGGGNTWTTIERT